MLCCVVLSWAQRKAEGTESFKLEFSAFLSFIMVSMLVKCETKSNRVKGLSFHPKLTWILAGLHNGAVQMWDYRIGSLMEKFEEHEGPVRGVAFHDTQPIFVSGGDDYKIKVWNYKQRRCTFTLLGHLDYIRTVEFHPEYPWILSSSDDQTVRIWNWQSRQAIAVMTGHNHYVMCAQFHPTEDMVVSASLDQMIRVWDVSALKDKTVSAGGGLGKRASGSQPASDVFGPSDAVVKFVLEGHDRGVNWASFHPTQPLIVSCADDRLVKLWRYTESKCWELDTMRGHFNNVSSVCFLGKKDLIVSDSEDRTIRVWNAQSRTQLHTFRRESDRFWIITAHKNSNLIAAGHDSGMVVFKLDRERPMLTTGTAGGAAGAPLFWANQSSLHVINMEKAIPKEAPSGACEGQLIGKLRRPVNAMTSGYRYLLANPYNSTEVNLLAFYNKDGGAYDLIVLSNNLISGKAPIDGKRPDLQSSDNEAKGGSAGGVTWVGRNRFAALHADGQIGIYSLQNELVKKFEPPCKVDDIYLGGNNRVLIKTEDKMVLYDLSSRKVVGEVAAPGGAGAQGVRYVIWSQKMDYVALLSKHNVTIASGKSLEYLASLHENIRVKSGVWDENGAFVYSTLSHIKYILAPSGESGLIQGLPEGHQAIYLARASVKTKSLVYVDRDSNVHKTKLNCQEYMFKLALEGRRAEEVKDWIKAARMQGNVLIGYLKRQGFPEVALQFVEDPKTRFNLALEFGHLEEATGALKSMEEGKDIKLRDLWERLGKEALRQGNAQIMEMVFQKIKSFDSLAFLYMTTGHRAKLEKMLLIAQKLQDSSARFNVSLMLGDVEERVRVLAETGQLPLALLTAKTYGLAEYVDQLTEAIDAEEGNMGSSSQAIDYEFEEEGDEACCLIPSMPLCQPSQTPVWPLTIPADQIFNNQWEGVEEAAKEAPVEEDAGPPDFDEIEAEWSKAGQEEEGLDLTDAGGAWGGDDDLGLEGLVFPDVQEKDISSEMPSAGDAPESCWLKNRRMVCDLVAAGDFSEALSVLTRRVGLKNAAPLKGLFWKAYCASHCTVPLLPGTPSLNIPILHEGSRLSNPASAEPAVLFDSKYVSDMVKEGYRLTTQGNFQDVLSTFRDVLLGILMSVARSSDEEAQILDCIDIAKEYILAMRLELSRRELAPSEVKRSVELVSYLTTCKLQPAHQLLTLRVAMTTAFKAQNFLTAASFARRLVQQGGRAGVSGAEIVTQARKVLAVCEQKATDAHQIEFDPSAFESSGKLRICAGSLSILPPSAPGVRCPYCNSEFKVDYKGKVCSSCQVSEVGARVLGVQLCPL